MYLSIVDVKPLEGYKLLLTFENKEMRTFDVSPYLSMGEFSKLKDPSLFDTVAVKFDSIEWSNHLDLDPELLYQGSVCMTEK